MREIAFDTETTGFDPATGHRIVEIGCVEMWGRVRTGKTFQAYLNPQRDMPEEAFAVHGLSAQFLSDKPLFNHIAPEFMAFIGDAPLVIHNAQFDMKFLNFELKKAGLECVPFERAIDTVSIARRKFPGAPAKLDALCKRFNIDLTARSKHGALLDAELLADVYLELMGGRQGAMILAQGPAAQSGIAIASSGALLPHREFSVSEEEVKAHDAFIRGIKNALWLSEKYDMTA